MSGRLKRHFNGFSFGAKPSDDASDTSAASGPNAKGEENATTLLRRKAARLSSERKEPQLSDAAALTRAVALKELSLSTPLSTVAKVGPKKRAHLSAEKAVLRKLDDGGVRPVGRAAADLRSHRLNGPVPVVEDGFKRRGPAAPAVAQGAETIVPEWSEDGVQNLATQTKPVVEPKPSVDPKPDVEPEPIIEIDLRERARGPVKQAAPNDLETLPPIFTETAINPSKPTKKKATSSVKPAIVEKRASFQKTATARDGVFQNAMETGRTRLLIAATMMTLAFGVVGARLIDVTGFQHKAEPSVARIAADAALTGARIEGGRAAILDRNGVLLATDLSTYTLFADPKYVHDPRETAYRLASVIPELDPASVEAKLRKGGRYVLLQHSLTPQQHHDIIQLGLPGVDFDKGVTRTYPHGSLFSHILGYTSVDNRGIAGLEHRFDEALRVDQTPIQLSVDSRIQHILHTELSTAMAEYSAVGAAGIVMDAKTGEIMGMASLPDFDPNNPMASPKSNKFNRVSKGLYELGSTFKIFNTAMAIDAGIVSINDRYDARKPLKVGRFTINDFHAENRWLTVPEIFLHSSNIGSAQMALDVGGAEQQAFLRRIGFFDRLPVELPETGTPLRPDIWRPINTMTVSYGHGLSVSPLHLATGVAAMVNGGILHRPTLVKAEIEPAGDRVVSARTSDTIRTLMRLNALEGSGTKAIVEGYAVGGKTGSAEKPGGAKGYNRKALISSFIGAFPMHDPRYVVYVILDEPQGTKDTLFYATGGWVAAPSVGAIIRQIGPLLGVEPVQEEEPHLQRQLAILSPQSGATLAALEQ